MKTYQPRMAFLVVLLAASVLFRLIPYMLLQLGMSIDPATTVYPWNFSPLYALCLFGGAFFRDKRWAVAVPLLTYFIGDLLIVVLTGRIDFGFYPGQSFVYAAVALSVAFGFLLRQNRPLWKIGTTGFAAAAMFYLVTNFGSWLAYNGQSYPMTLNGLIQCYVMAIPFFRMTLISMAVYLPLFFCPLAVEQLERADEPEAELSSAQQTA